MMLNCMTAAWALPDKDEQGYYLVYNLQDLKDAVNATKDSNGRSTSKIRLANHIYLNGMANTLCTTFEGEIDGKYTRKNNKGEDIGFMYAFYGSTPGDEGTRKKCSYLFTKLEGATIKNVAFCNIRVESDDRDNMGVIASTATTTTFKQITMDRCSVFTDENNAGALVGQATDCKFYIVFVNSCDVTVDGVRAGGFVGNSENNQYVYGGSSLGTAVFADGNNWKNAGWSGGIAGYSKNDNFFYMANLALVGADQNFVGGYAGESEGSNFYRCQNSGAVLQIDEDDSDPDESFRAIHKKMLEEINKKKSTSTLDAGLDKDTKLLAYALNVAGDLDVRELLDLPTQPSARLWTVIDGMFLCAPTAETLVGTFEVMTSAETQFLTLTMELEAVEVSATATGAGASAGVSMTAVCGIAAVVAVAVAATVIAIHIYNGDDEVGGICGKATGGFFEQCTNNSTLSCRDDNLGGIVGLGKGVTINNCLNTGKIILDEKVCSGSILGQAEANGSKKCKVTNCLSLTELQIVGTNDVSKGMDPASGNNYCIDRSIVWQDIVDWQDLRSGIVTYWLNNGIENREKGLTPWRQNIGSDSCPVLDITHDIVKRDMLFDMEIGTVDQLRKFAEMVNFGNVDTNAKLVADIDMTNEWWTPIGYDDWGHRFCGIFDGQGHTIKGLTYKSDERPAGLFGCVTTNAEIRNVIIGDGSEFRNSNEGAGAIVGRVHYDWTCGNVIIEDCGSYANVSGKKHAGGILGRVSTGDESDGVKVYINKCFSSGIITADDGNSGLISGYMKNHGYVSNCWSNAQLRIGDGYTTWPYGCERGINECFVGYDKDLNINNCFITDPDKKVDRYTEKELQSGVTTVTSAEVANGMLTYKLNGGNKTSESHIWQQNLLANSAPVHGSKGVYYTHDIFESGFGTICLPYTVRSNDKVKYYRLVEVAQSEDKVELIFDYATSIGSGVPCLYVSSVDEASHEFLDDVGFIYRDETYEYSVSGWYLKGTFTDLSFKNEAAKSIYTISTKGNVNNNPRSNHVSPYRAYIDGPNIDTLNGKTIHLVVKGVNDVATTVGTLPLREGQGGSSYTLMGTKAPAGYKGIVIQNGRKYVK